MTEMCHIIQENFNMVEQFLFGARKHNFLSFIVSHTKTSVTQNYEF